MNLLYFLLLVLFWGGSFLAIHFAVDVVPPFAAAGLRTSIATAFFLVVILIGRVPFRGTWRSFLRVGGIGLINFGIPWACLFWGETRVAPAIASVLNGTVPIFVLIFSFWLLDDEPFTFLKLAGVLLALTGMVVIFSPQLTSEGGGFELPGLIAITAMAAFYALGGIAYKRSIGLMSRRWNLMLQTGVASVGLLALSLWTEGSGWVTTLPSQPKAMLSLLYLGTLSTAVAWFMYSHLIHAWGALRSSTVTYFIPWVAIAIDWFHFGVWPEPEVLSGAVLIITGVALTHVARHRFGAKPAA